MTTKDLKQKHIELDPALGSWWQSEIRPLASLIEKKKRQLDALLQETFNKKMFPGRAMKYYRSVLLKNENLTESQRLRRLSLWIDDVKEPQIRKRYWRIRNQITEARKTFLEKISEKGYELHYDFIHSDSIDPVEYVLCDEVGSIKDEFPHTMLIKGLERKGADRIIRNGVMYLQVDLTYDKTKIVRMCDDAISIAKKALKVSSRADTMLKLDLFNWSFLDHYLNGDNKLRALQKTQRDLRDNCGLHLNLNTLERKYLPEFKKAYGINDLRELRTKGGLLIK